MIPLKDEVEIERDENHINNFSEKIDENNNFIQNVIKTDIPWRLDRLPFSRYHYFIVFTLGITWMLDGLETTLIGKKKIKFFILNKKFF